MDFDFEKLEKACPGTFPNFYFSVNFVINSLQALCIHFRAQSCKQRKYIRYVFITVWAKKLQNCCDIAPYSQELGNYFTSRASENHLCMAAHRFGQYFLAPSTELHLICAFSSDSFLGIGSSPVKYMSDSFSLFIKRSLAVVLSLSFVTARAISRTFFWKTRIL